MDARLHCDQSKGRTNDRVWRLKATDVNLAKFTGYEHVDSDSNWVS